MGTLDPMASGVLPVAIGKTTRLFDYLLDKEKIYIAEFEFGYETDTLDAEGQIIKRTEKLPTEEEIIKILPSLTGVIEQIPPVFSAKKVDGKRSYDLARHGETVTLQPKKVEIDSIKLLEKTADNRLKFEIVCKGGTYIRSICRDMAYALKSFATMVELERVKSGIFTAENSVSLEELTTSEDVKSFLIPSDSAVSLDKINLSDKVTADLLNGRIALVNNSDGLYSVYHDKEFLGVGEVNGGRIKLKAYLKDDD